MNKILTRRLGPFLALFALVVLLSALVVGLISDGSFLESLELIVIVIAGLVGFLGVVAVILLTGVVFAFLIARAISFLHP
ncbi:hypothetical protein HALLA_16335 [Halostagnicola larsenii XH-48]|uniref:Uncharacterized protein n=1 Tax=Halostagnicola larsenii XH-48 TaxID=797299 RepID=W0JQT7_9EURY|nr:hypothetical protein [Halostagnicola larsenii]AHG01096.1 hypothetical protein HALLA_16335 [Halostagnicola larsenii XH-48]